MLIGNEGKLSIETMDWVTDRSEKISLYSKAEKSVPYIAAVFEVDEDSGQVFILGDGKILF